MWSCSTLSSSCTFSWPAPVTTDVACIEERLTDARAASASAGATPVGGILREGASPSGKTPPTAGSARGPDALAQEDSWEDSGPVVWRRGWWIHK